jgi:glyoxylase-like metal-dependent hydrolase (beta-lactamase superfamily II)
LWFEESLIAPGLRRITEGGFVHTYLLEGSERAVLVDSGFGIGDIGAVVKGLTAKPILVVNTHGHLDHVGGNSHFDVTLLHQAESLKDAADSAPRFREAAAQEDFPVPFPEGFKPSQYAPQVPEPTHRVAGGEVIDLGGRALEVLPTPGHTIGSICLLEESNRFLFTGDTVMDRPLQGIGEGVSLSVYQDSLQMLAGMAPDLDLILPGHGPSPLPAATLSELAECARQLDQSAFCDMNLSGRKTAGMNVGRFVFFLALRR